MNIKDIFDKGENGMLNYEQFVKLTTDNKAKFIDLSEGNYVDKQKYTDDLAARDTRISTLDETVKTRDTDLAKLQEQLKNAGTDADKLSALTTDFANLQKKYDDDVKAYEKQIKEQNYRHAVNDFANQQKFSSQAAKRDFVGSLMGKKLQMDGDTIIGASDFMSTYAQSNPDAFIVEDNNAGAGKPQPHFAGPTAPQSSNGGDTTPFKFDFVGVRPHDK